MFTMVAVMTMVFSAMVNVNRLVEPLMLAMRNILVIVVQILVINADQIAIE
jgi:hypothetical protein